MDEFRYEVGTRRNLTSGTEAPVCILAIEQPDKTWRLAINCCEIDGQSYVDSIHDYASAQDLEFALRGYSRRAALEFTTQMIKALTPGKAVVFHL